MRSDPSVTPPWAALLAQNTPGTARLPVPVFVAQGASDTLIKPAITQQWATQQQRGGVRLGVVTFRLVVGLLTAVEEA